MRCASALQPAGYALTERLCVYPQYIDPEWMAQGVLDTIKLKYWSFIPRRGSGRRRRTCRSAPTWSPAAIERARDNQRLTHEELTALFAERRPEVIEDMRLAADEIRARLAGEIGRPSSSTGTSTSPTSARSAARSAASARASARLTPTSRARTTSSRRCRSAVDYGVTEICMQGGIHPEYTLEDYGRWLKLVKEVAPHVHLHAYSPMEVHYMCERSGKRPRGRVRVPDRMRPRLDARHGGGGAPRRRARSASPRTSCPSSRWVEIIEASHRTGLRSTVTVMFGHIEEPWELAEHMQVVRELQERTGGFTEFVPLSFIPFHTLLGRTHGIEEISREENLKHTAVFRLALGDTITNLQASWVKMGLDAATESLRWGVNDLGGTLMEESISRMAGSLPRRPARPRAADRRGARAAGAQPAQRDTLYRILETY